MRAQIWASEMLWIGYQVLTGHAQAIYHLMAMEGYGETTQLMLGREIRSLALPMLVYRPVELYQVEAVLPCCFCCAL